MMSNIQILYTPIEGGGFRLHAKSAFTKEDLYSRLPFSNSEVNVLAKSDVTIFGLGSGGALLALRFAQAGVGKLRLIDPAPVQVHNIIRHLATLEDVGRTKVLVAGENVLLHNPSAIVDIYPYDVFSHPVDNDVETILSPTNLILAATDKVNVQLMINAIAWKMKIPAVFGGCYEGAKGGEVLFTLPGEGTPCLACLRAGLKPPENSDVFDYSSVNTIDDFIGEPGFAASVDLITNVEAQVALGVLLREETTSALGKLIHPKLNYLLIGGALGTGYYKFKRPFHIFWQPLAGPRPGCPVCQSIDSDDISTMCVDEVPNIGSLDELDLDHVYMINEVTTDLTGIVNG
jgi:molybdopterin/thiamine biosynthesis adenylyltransferase